MAVITKPCFKDMKIQISIQDSLIKKKKIPKKKKKNSKTTYFCFVPE